MLLTLSDIVSFTNFKPPRTLLAEFRSQGLGNEIVGRTVSAEQKLEFSQYSRFNRELLHHGRRAGIEKTTQI